MAAQIFALTLILILMFFIIRGWNTVYLHSVLRKRDRQKRPKKQSFWEWFFYLRYLDVLPKARLFVYYAHMALYPITIVLVCVFHAMNFSDKQIGYVIWGYMAFSAIPILPTYYQSRFGSRDKKR